LIFSQDIIADFWLFRPTVGCQLKGVVTKKSASHISCLVHGVFNVPCHRPYDHDPEAPWFGAQVAIGSSVWFNVIKTDMSQKVPFILGSLLDQQLEGSPDAVASKVLNAIFFSIFTLFNPFQGPYSETCSNL
jgi:DNA-directed RNA polymerase I subunit RPA43